MTMIRRLFNRKENDQSTTKMPAEGTLAPDFSLPTESGESLSLSDLRGQPIVLVFYPADNSRVCSNQLALYNEALSMFKKHDAQIVGISVDGSASHRAFASALDLDFPLLADDDPLGEVAKTYGVFDEHRDVSERALFVIDGQGVIRWRHLSPPGVNPGANGILEALESLEDET
jgi:peroxiredoxin